MMKKYDEKGCSEKFGLNLLKAMTFTIDGLILCPTHTEQYISQSMATVSIYREKFNILLKKMKSR